LGSGYFMFSFPSTVTFYCSIGLLVIGNGLFKPNISTLVGNLYPQGDPRRDSAFSIFYMGINLGALFAGPVGETMRGWLGWPVAFATAGCGMVASFLIFSTFLKYVSLGDTRSSVAAVLDVPLPAEYEDKPDPPELERKRIIALGIMCLIVVFFWMAFEQNGTTLTFWAKENTDRVLHLGSFTWEVPVGWFQSFNPLFIICLTPLMVALMSYLRTKNLEPSTPAKIGLGMGLTAASYGIMVVASRMGGDTGKVHMAWLVACYFVITIAELFLSPMGLSMVTKLSPRRMTSLMMGVWFLANATGNKLSGFYSKYWDSWKHSEVFMLLVVSSLVAAALLISQYRRLLEAMPPEGPQDEKKASVEPEPAVAAAAESGA